ncbi:methyltransferase family protein [Cereibacter azotoformans]|uniref:Methyltransferase family protein n=1 Tax=Cereibacter azotoformans TaxID=43057 RepID=A0A2T5JKA2_9RHOB|nr:methyltransferase family protein [Cereibacter azotoformans]
MKANHDLVEDIRDYWSRRSATFDLAFGHRIAPGPEAHAWAQPMRDHLGPAPARVLELACGTGEVTRLVHDLGHDVTALDFSEPMLAVARAKHAGKPGSHGSPALPAAGAGRRSRARRTSPAARFRSPLARPPRRRPEADLLAAAGAAETCQAGAAGFLCPSSVPRGSAIRAPHGASARRRDGVRREARDPAAPAALRSTGREWCRTPARPVPWQRRAQPWPVPGKPRRRSLHRPAVRRATACSRASQVRAPVRAGHRHEVDGLSVRATMRPPRRWRSAGRQR